MSDSAGAFVRRILDAPTDPLIRLVFADWLDETGTTANVAWADYLRLRAAAGQATNATDRILASRGAAAVAGLVTARLSVVADVFTPNFVGLLDLLPALNYSVAVAGFSIDRAVLGRLTEPAALRWRGLPLAAHDGRVLLGMVVPGDAQAVAELGRLVTGNPVAVAVPGDQLSDLVDRTFTRAIALVTPRPPAGGGPREQLEQLIRQAHDRQATALELTAEAVGYQVYLVHAGQSLPWVRLVSEVGRAMAETAATLPAGRLSVQVMFRSTGFGPGLRIVLLDRPPDSSASARP